MSEPVFIYSGADIQGPLRRLLAHLQNRHATAYADLVQYIRTNDDAIAVWAGTIDPRATESDRRRQERAQSYVMAVEAVRETELWLFEASRSPLATWALDLGTVARLYPVQIAPETTAVELLRTPEPWPRLNRFFAWFASAFARPRQVDRPA